jgi:hypothetical protein
MPSTIIPFGLHSAPSGGRLPDHVLLILGWALAGYPAIHGRALPVTRRLISTG